MAKIYHDISFYGTGRIECRLCPPGNARIRQRNDQLHRGKRRETNEKEERKQRSNCDSSECIFLFFYKYPLKLMTIVKRTAIITGTVKSIQDKGRYSDDR